MFYKYMNSMDLANFQGPDRAGARTLGNLFYPRWEKLFRRLFAPANCLQLVGSCGTACRKIALSEWVGRSNSKNID